MIGRDVERAPVSHRLPPVLGHEGSIEGEQLGAGKGRGEEFGAGQEDEDGEHRDPQPLYPSVPPQPPAGPICPGVETVRREAKQGRCANHQEE